MFRIGCWKRIDRALCPASSALTRADGSSSIPACAADALERQSGSSRSPHGRESQKEIDAPETYVRPSPPCREAMCPVSHELSRYPDPLHPANRSPDCLHLPLRPEKSVAQFRRRRMKDDAHHPDFSRRRCRTSSQGTQVATPLSSSLMR
jgi:hypothetical protein